MQYKVLKFSNKYGFMENYYLCRYEKKLSYG